VNTTEILQKLHGLAAEDRAWIVARLPTRAKAQLLAMSSDGETPEVTPMEVAHAEEERIPADIDVGRLAAVLAEEPYWVAAVLLEGSGEPWVAAVLERLPAGVRAGIATAQRGAQTFTPHAKQTLIRTVLARVGCGEPAPARSRFQSLLARLSASRSRKRLTIHL
jgi:hypothetical protein